MTSGHPVPLLWYLLLFVGLLSPVSCLPASSPSKYNETVSEYNTPLGKVKFHAEPLGRGTVGIIFSCTATYIFCVWTAVHPNINVKTTWGARLWYKCVLMVLSVIVPEGLLVCAVGQYLEARTIKQAWKEKMVELKKDKDIQKKVGMNEAFFIVMGGFLTDIIKHPNPALHEHEYGEKLTPGTYTAILTPTGFLNYLQNGYIDENSFDVSEIADKGKANNIAKLLACGQALWLVVQSFARWGSLLPVTLLEIHVLIQVFCTMFIYTCWWSKPLDVDEPVKIKLRYREQGGDGEHSPPRFNQQGVLQAQVKKTKTYSRSNHLVTKIPCSKSIAIKSKAFFDLVTYIYSEGIYSEGIQGTSPGLKKKVELYGVVGMVVEGSLVVLVGGLHLFAWNVHFPSGLESLLWKGCSFGMIIFPSIVVIVASFTRYELDLFPILWEVHFEGLKHRALLWFGIRKIHHICTKHALKSTELHPDDRWSLAKYIHYGLRVLLNYALVYLCLLSLLCYALCTSFIVVESYISMRDPPPGVFKTPRWSDYWPHL